VRDLFPADWKLNRATSALFGAHTRKLMGGAMTDVTRFVKVVKEAWAAARESDGWRIAEPGKNGHLGRTIWFVPNEVDGFTAMFPSDY